MKKYILLFLSLYPSFAVARGGIDIIANPKAILNSTNTWTATQNFNSSTTFINNTLGINGLTYIWPGSQGANTCLKTDGAGNLSWGACGGGGGGGGGGALFLTPDGVSITTATFPKFPFGDFRIQYDGVSGATITVNDSTGTRTATYTFANSSTVVLNSTWNLTNSQLAIGTSVPRALIHISSTPNSAVIYYLTASSNTKDFWAVTSTAQIMDIPLISGSSAYFAKGGKFGRDDSNLMIDAAGTLYLPNGGSSNQTNPPILGAASLFLFSLGEAQIKNTATGTGRQLTLGADSVQDGHINFRQGGGGTIRDAFLGDGSLIVGGSTCTGGDTRFQVEGGTVRIASDTINFGSMTVHGVITSTIGFISASSTFGWLSVSGPVYVTQGFGIVQSSGIQVGGVQFTTFMSTIDTRINGLAGGGVPPSVQSPSTGIYNLRSDAGVRYGIANSTGIEVGDFLQVTTYMSTSDARMNSMGMVFSSNTSLLSTTNTWTAGQSISSMTNVSTVCFNQTCMTFPSISSAPLAGVDYIFHLKDGMAYFGGDNAGSGGPGGGGTSPSLSVGTGTIAYMQPASSPTASLNFSDQNFSATLIQGATAFIDLSSSAKTISLAFNAGGDATSIIYPSSSNAIIMPYNATITSFTILSPNEAGEARVRFSKATYANFPTFTDICTARCPSLSGTTKKNVVSDMTGWTNIVDKDDIFMMATDSATATITNLTVQLNMIRR